MGCKCLKYFLSMKILKISLAHTLTNENKNNHVLDCETCVFSITFVKNRFKNFTDIILIVTNT